MRRFSNARSLGSVGFIDAAIDVVALHLDDRATFAGNKSDSKSGGALDEKSIGGHGSESALGSAIPKVDQDPVFQNELSLSIVTGVA
jgi:hypothetical protein